MRIYKKLALVLSLLMATSFSVFSFVGCGKGGDSSESSSSSSSSSAPTDSSSGGTKPPSETKGGEISVGVLQGTNYQSVASALKSAFEEKYSTEKYKVNVVEIVGDYNLELQKMQRKGTLPDVCMAFSETVDYWSARNVFISLNDYIARDSVDTTDLVDCATEKLTLETTGKTYWLPNSIEKQVVYLNKDVMQSVGVSLDLENQWNWNALKTFAEEVNAKDTDVYPIQMSVEKLETYFALFKNFGVELGGNGVAFQGAEADIFECMEWISEMSVDELITSNQDATIENTAVWVGTRADLPAYVQANVNFEILPMPETADGKAYAGYTTSGFAMTQACEEEEKQIAWEFIKYAISDEGQEVAGKTGYTTPTSKALTDKTNAEWKNFATNVSNDLFIVTPDCDVNGAFLKGNFSEERQLVAYEEYAKMMKELTNTDFSSSTVSEFFAQNGKNILQTKYEVDTYMLPVWEGNTVYYESAMIVGTTGEILLSDEPKEVVGVYDYALKTKYVEGIDYTVDGNVIKRISRGNLPYAKKSDVYSSTPGAAVIKVEPSRCPDYTDNGETTYLTYGEKDTYTRMQIVVTYTRANGWQGETPEGKRERFSNFNEKLEKGEDVKIVVYGDSISEGCNSSGTIYGGNVAPYADSWSVMLQKKLQRDYGVNVGLRNVALGGKDSGWAVNNFEERVLSEDADLLILGFGMNDGGTPVDTYRARIEEMVLKFREHNPTGEVVLLAPMLPNVESNWLKNQTEFAEELYKIENQCGYASVSDMTAMHWDLLEMGKRYRDMTGNNINHPNDFLARIYGQVIMHTVLNCKN